MISPTYGKVNMEQIIQLIAQLYEKSIAAEAEFEITIGTDSQNFSDTQERNKNWAGGLMVRMP